MSCAHRHTTVSREEAYAILDPYVEAARELYTAAGYDVRSVRFAIQDVHDTPRHFAACREDGQLIVAAAELVELPEPTVAAILAHEFGHALDFLHPGRFVLTEDGVQERGAPPSETQLLRWLSAWQTRDEYVVEVTADRLAESVYGAPIGYAGPCRLQTFRGGVPRPEELR